MPPTLPFPVPLDDPERVFGPARVGEDALLAQLAAVALEAAAAATVIQLAGLGHDRERVDAKSSATDLVSEVDRGAEQAVVDTLAQRRPEDGVLGEEGASRAGTSGVRWVVDPLDGTTNYLFGIPAYSVSVAAELDGRSLVGLVVDPSRGEAWGAVAGRGSRSNGELCRPATERSVLATALVGTGFSYLSERRAWQAGTLAHVLPAVHDIRRFGSAALDLCWVAGGRLDAYYEWGLNEWDAAAGRLICEEAGVVVSEHPSGTIVAAVQPLDRPLRALLADAGALA